MHANEFDVHESGYKEMNKSQEVTRLLTFDETKNERVYKL